LGDSELHELLTIVSFFTTSSDSRLDERPGGSVETVPTMSTVWPTWAAMSISFGALSR
jgi:hypothetical protein